MVRRGEAALLSRLTEALVTQPRDCIVDLFRGGQRGSRSARLKRSLNRENVEWRNTERRRREAREREAGVRRERESRERERERERETERERNRERERERERERQLPWYISPPTMLSSPSHCQRRGGPWPRVMGKREVGLLVVLLLLVGELRALYSPKTTQKMGTAECNAL